MVVLITGDQITQQKLPFSVSVATGRQREGTGTCVVVDEHNAHRGDTGDKFREHFITSRALLLICSLALSWVALPGRRVAVQGADLQPGSQLGGSQEMGRCPGC
ncbi:unnamed protein product [Arctogadus glacialis]